MGPSDHDKNDPFGGASAGDHGPTHASGGPSGGEGWLRSVLENSSEVVKVVDPDGTLRYASPAFGRVFGHDPVEAVGKMNVLDYVHPDDLPRVLEETERATSVGGTISNRAEYRFRHADGSWRWVESVGTYLPDDPQVGGVVVSVRDVTGRKEAEERLRLQAQLLEAVGEAVIALDADERVVFWNRAAKGMYGFSAGEIVGRRLMERVVPEDSRTHAEEVMAGVRAGLSWKGEFVARRRDGTPLTVEATNTPVLGENGEQVGVVGVLRDVTERRESEEALRQSEAELFSVLESITDAFFTLDHEMRFAYVNPKAEDLLSSAREDLIGERIWEDPTFYPHYRRAVEEGATVRFEALYPPSGAWYSVRAYPSASGLSVYLQDITQRKEAEETLKRSEERFRSLVRNASEVILVMGGDEAVRYVSPALERVLGYRPEDVVGNDSFDAVHPDDKTLVRGVMGDAVKSPGVSMSVELRLRHADGSWRRMESNCTSLLGDPDVGGIVFNSRDVTEPRRAEEALRRSEALLAESQRIAGLGTWEWDVRTGEVWWSEETYRIHGFQPGPEVALRGKVEEALFPEDLPLYRRKIEAALSGEVEGYDYEHRMRRADGEVRWVHAQAEVFRGEDGKPLRVVGSVHDVTGRKEAERALRESEERFRGTFEDAPIGVALVGLPSPSPDTDRRYLRVNPALCEMLGYAEEELLSMTTSDVTHPEDLERSRARMGQLFEEGGSRYTLEKRYVRSDGRVVWAMLNVSLVRDADGNPSHLVAQFQDVTERKETEEALRRSEERYRTVVERQTELVCRFLPDLTLTFANEAYARYYGLNPEELVGRTFLDHVHESDHAYYEQGLVRLSPHHPTTTVEERFFTPVGVRWLQWTDTALFDAEGNVVEYQSVGRDVTERRALEERLRHQALHDPLTGLPNRRLFVDRLGQALGRTRRRKGSRAAVLFMDLDNFKGVNDSLGHEVGDLLLVAAAERLKRRLRPEDTLARFGGDEFVVLVEDVEDPDEAVRVAERIAEGFGDPFRLGDRELYASASIGIAAGDARTETPEDLLRDADTAMYRAKDGGLGYSLFDPAMHERAMGRLELENDLRRAIREEEFVVHYQPIVRLDDRSVRGVEALVRWQHPERGLLNPNEFVPVAEESGLVVPMGEAVLGEACQRAKDWQDTNPKMPPLVLSVNVSARQLARPDLAETVEGVLERTGFEGDCLDLDVTETVYVKVLEGNTAALDRLRASGVRISIDDFGVGYSSLSYLKRLPADVLKVDRSFVGGLGEDAEDTAIVGMIIELAHTLGMEVVAEGVETEGQAELLREMGCDFGQGYFYSKPLPPEDVPEFLEG